MGIVFLDIDGVMQPQSSIYRFGADAKIIEKLSNKHNIDYYQYGLDDVAAVYYDWDEQAVSRLKHILDTTDSRIIISSNWRNKKKPQKMRDLLTIQGLGEYWFADNIDLGYQPNSSVVEVRAREIEDSLRRYDIDNFAVLDDWPQMKNYFPNNSVITHESISIPDMKECIRILKR